MTKKEIIDVITLAISNNGERKITGDKLREVLIAMVNSSEDISFSDIEDALGVRPSLLWGKNNESNVYYFGFDTSSQTWMDEEVSVGDIFLVRYDGQYSLDPKTEDVEPLVVGDYIQCTAAGTVESVGYITNPIFERVQLNTISKVLSSPSKEQVVEAIAAAVEGVNNEIIAGELVAAASLNDLNDRVNKLPTKENVSEEIDAKLQAMRDSIVAMIDNLRAEIIDDELVSSASLNDLNSRI